MVDFQISVRDLGKKCKCNRAQFGDVMNASLEYEASLNSRAGSTSLPLWTSSGSIGSNNFAVGLIAEFHIAGMVGAETIEG